MTRSHLRASSRSSPWRRRVAAAWCLAACALSASALPARAQVPGPVLSRNFDGRAEPSSPAAPEPDAAPNAALQAFAANRPNLAVSVDDRFGVTSRLYDRLGHLTPPDPRDPGTIALDFIATNLAVLGLDQADLAEYEVSDTVVNRATGSTHLYLRQTFQGIAVYNGLLHVNINRDGRILSVNNAWVRGLAATANAAAPGLAAGDAVARAAQSLYVGPVLPPRSLGPPEGVKQRTSLDPTGISIAPLEAELVWLPVASGDVRLAWNFQVHTADDAHIFDMTVDASDGEIWTRFDWVAGDSYAVYPAPAESPNHVSPAPPADGRTVVADPAHAVASPYGWHDTNGAAGAEYTTMRGNNVHAYIDDDNNNAPPASEPDCGPTLTCEFPVDLTQAPSTYAAAAVANLFYWNNHIHDVQYQYGFTEVAGNFQVNNYGRGGAGNDSVRAEAQDGGGVNNANFATPGDGSSPRMQMYLWTTASPNLDGDFDNGIIAHEYGHGISNRLVGGPSNVSCLNNSQQPGEGLSDWWSLVYTAQASDAGTDGRGIGTYALNQPTTGSGIRAQRYSTDPNINTWTYASINGMAVPHGVGSVWAQAAWEMYWALVDTHGFDADLLDASAAAGNQRAMLYVNEGLMNTACSPTFTDVRDGIIQAATDNYGGEDVCLLWSAFAHFGLGTNAVSGGANSTSPTDGFGLPAACLPNAPEISIGDTSVTEGDTLAPDGISGGFTVTLSAASSESVAVDYTTADGTAVASNVAATYSNPTSMALPGTGTKGIAAPYPSSITIPATVPPVGLTDVSVTLTGFSHTYPADIDILLAGPTGATVLLMSRIGGGTDANDVTLTFNDAAPSMAGPVTSGTYAPTDNGFGYGFPAPAPGGTPGAALAVFDGTNPAGTWSLYIVDQYSIDAGTLSGGWSLTVSTPAAASDYVATSGTLTFTPGTTSQDLTVSVNGDTIAEPSETFSVNLTNPVNATILDAEGIGTILDDDGFVGGGGGGEGGWTDDPLVAGSTELKAAHITELRTRIDALRDANGLAATGWTDPTLIPGVTLSKAVHLTELRTALAEVYSVLDQTPPSYTEPAISAGVVINVAHINELRAAVAAIE